MLEESMTTYRTAFEGLTSLPETDLQLARENDQSIIYEVIDLHRKLRPGQVLVLRVNLAEHDNNDEFVPPNKYAGIVHDEPTEFIRRLRQALIEYNQAYGCNALTEPFPEQIEIVIPPNVVSQEELGTDMKATQVDGLLVNIKMYLRLISIRIAYLVINLTGVFSGIELPLHPSMIEGVRIEESGSPDRTNVNVVFRAVPV
jgi:hypothetical protein